MMFHVSMFQHVPVFISWKLQVHLPPPQGQRPPFKTELPPPPPKNDLERAPWRSGHVVPPRNKDAA